MNIEEAMKLVQPIPGSKGFWKAQNHAAFAHYLIRLINQGMSVGAALGFLNDIFYTVANEYGD